MNVATGQTLEVRGTRQIDKTTRRGCSKSNQAKPGIRTGACAWPVWRCGAGVAVRGHDRRIATRIHGISTCALTSCTIITHMWHVPGAFSEPSIKSLLLPCIG